MTDEEAHAIRMEIRALKARAAKLRNKLRAADESLHTGNMYAGKPDGPKSIGINAYNAQWRERNREHTRKYMREYMRKFRAKRAVSASMDI